jgi:predicted kinase
MPKPSLIVIGGFAGAGKTTIAKKLSETYNYPVFSSDVINDALRAAQNISFKEASPTAYKIMWHLVKKQLQTGITVIIDAHMAAQHTWDSLDELKQRVPKAQIIPIILRANLEIHRSRIEERGRTNKEHLNLGGDKLEDVLHKYGYIENLKRPDVVWVNANKSVNEVYDAVEAIIKRGSNSVSGVKIEAIKRDWE